MMVEDLLSRCDAVRRSGRGYSARCPAHDDHSPSLSVHEGEAGILLHCWAGCRVDEIAAAMGLRVAELFYDADLPPHERRQSRRQPRPRPFDWRRYAGEFEDEALGLWLRAQSVLAAARGLQTDDLTDDDIEVALEAVTRARVDLARAACHESVAFTVRAWGLRKEQERERTRRAA